MADPSALTAAVEAGQRADAVSLTQAAIDEGVAPAQILDAMTVAMTEVGRKFACNEGVYVPEMLIAAHAMKEATVLIEPLLAASGVTPDHTAVIGTVQGDLHDIDKDLVGMMLKGANFEIVDLGTNVAPAAFAEAATAHEAGAGMALHAVEPMEGLLTSARERRFYELTTTFERPDPLPVVFPAAERRMAAREDGG